MVNKNKKQIVEGVDILEATDICNTLMGMGKKFTVDPLEGKYWIIYRGEKI